MVWRILRKSFYGVQTPIFKMTYDERKKLKSMNKLLLAMRRKLSGWKWQREDLSDLSKNLVGRRGEIRALCDSARRTIVVDKKTLKLRSKERRRLVLLHELAHALAGPNSGHSQKFYLILGLMSDMQVEGHLDTMLVFKHGHRIRTPRFTLYTS